MNENRCLYCGEIIPEGRQVCPSCEKIQSETTKAERVDRVMNDWVFPFLLVGAVVVFYLLIRG